MKATRALVLFLLTVLLCPALASAGTLGPALNYEELLDMVRRAKDGDILLVSGEMTATEEAISSPALLQISGDGRAVLHRLHISDSSVVLSDVELRDSLTISGISNVELRTVRVEGAPGQSGLSLVGGGTLLIDGDCEITGGEGATGVSVSQRGGDLYVSVEGSIRGGEGGGSGMEVSPLSEYGTMMLAGTIRGGNDAMMGGTGPATAPGSVIVSTAEHLAMVVLVQCLHPGHRMLIGHFSAPLNMRTGSPAFGQIGASLSNAIFNQLWRHYGLPLSNGSPGYVSAKGIEFQAGYEKGVAAILSALPGGSSMLLHLGGSGGPATHPVQAILDDDIAGMVGRFASGEATLCPPTRRPSSANHLMKLAA